MKRYTIGEIVRLGLLKNHKGQPYKDKATVLRMVKAYNGIIIKKQTPWGIGYDVPQRVIDELNARWG